MNSEVIKEILHTLFSHLEKMETHTEALMQYLKEKEQVTDAQLAPYLESAGNASNVRWRAARVRIEYLLSEAEMEESREREKSAQQAKSAEPEKPAKAVKKSSRTSGMEEAVASDQQNASTGQSGVKSTSGSTEHEYSTQDKEMNPEENAGDQEAA